MFTAESIGIYTTRQKVVAFVISSVIVGSQEVLMPITPVLSPIRPLNGEGD
jgi:hypothetical protein